jgi:hypothetical protein
MKQIHCLFIACIAVCMVSSCSLKRNNLLEPLINSGETPPVVTDITASGSGAGVTNKYIQVQWKKNAANTDGYYIYLGLDYNTEFAKYASYDSNQSENNSDYISKIIDIQSAGYYYIKVSAYRYLDSTDHTTPKLEGPLSVRVGVRVYN